MSCGQELAVPEFAPSYQRSRSCTFPLRSAASCLGSAQPGNSMIPGLLPSSSHWAVVPFPLVAIFPTNKQLLDPTVDPRGRAGELLQRWNRLHVNPNREQRRGLRTAAAPSANNPCKAMVNVTIIFALLVAPYLVATPLSPRSFDDRWTYGSLSCVLLYRHRSVPQDRRDVCAVAGGLCPSVER